jgi:hypothetical protein
VTVESAEAACALLDMKIPERQHHIDAWNKTFWSTSHRAGVAGEVQTHLTIE